MQKAYQAESEKNTVSGFVFFLFITLLIDAFLQLSARIPGVSIIRPTLLLTVLITMLLILQKEKFKDVKGNTIFIALNVMLIYLLVSLPLVEFTGSVIRDNFSRFIKVIAFFYFTAIIVDTRKRLVVFLVFFVGLQVFRGIEPLYLHITEGYWGDKTWVGDGEFANRLSGAPYDVVNPNGLGFVIVTAIPYLHYLLLPKGFLYKVLYFCLLSLMLYALMLTMSRGAMVVLFVIGWLIFKESKNKFALVIVAITFMVVGWMQLGDFQKDRYLSLVGLAEQTQNQKTSQGRLDGFIHEIGIGLSRPIVGHGIGTTPEAKYHLTGSIQASHNMYGELIIEMGLVGFVLFLRFILAIKQNLFSIKEKLLGKEKFVFFSQLNKALVAVFFMFAVYSLNYFGLNQYYWYLFGGLVVSVNRVLHREIEKVEKNINV